MLSVWKEFRDQFEKHTTVCHPTVKVTWEHILTIARKNKSRENRFKQDLQMLCTDYCRLVMCSCSWLHVVCARVQVPVQAGVTDGCEPPCGCRGFTQVLWRSGHALNHRGEGNTGGCGPRTHCKVTCSTSLCVGDQGVTRNPSVTWKILDIKRENNYLSDRNISKES